MNPNLNRLHGQPGGDAHACEPAATRFFSRGLTS